MKQSQCSRLLHGPERAAIPDLCQYAAKKDAIDEAQEIGLDDGVTALQQLGLIRAV
jgi:hypothetical protein